MVKAEFIRYIGVGLSNTLLTLALYWALLFVAVFSQFISDVGYTFLNPRIRFS